ncbi:MAG: GlcNAc-PI de-N-acetylase [Chloroflexi bacterium RBG_13_68_17]|jgi:LmbE family N-acetylglucosaminyl deacetylase|nr:MAG: GlcNAc-PI de-N-acetylase [Chloroflexi bacterium RBG_13_68_17]
MKWTRETAEVYVPDGVAPDEALARTSHLAVGAHQDDLEIMAIDGILQSYRRVDRWFTGVVVTDGAGSPRDGLYREYTDAQMRLVRREEQKKAAVVGGYAAQILLDHPSGAVKDGKADVVVQDLRQILGAARPQVVYTHNLADKHPTHVAVAVRVIQAIRSLPADLRPGKVYGCEVWRDLDWMPDSDKVVFNCSDQENLQAALLGVFDSQVSGGKRYDLATLGRRRANATYLESHSADYARGVAIAMDLTPLAADPHRDLQAYVQEHIDRFAQEVSGLIQKVL